MRRIAIRIAPAVLAANVARLGDRVAQAERTGADRIRMGVKGRS